ncbi:MAG TPA: hypothetical protein VIK14_10605 [Ignavibacteria bacterium]
MKKLIFLITTLFLFSSCGKQEERLKARIDSLEQKIVNNYKPGFGEFMSNIQVHHAKLWFAGLNQNWELADFEVQEIKETLEAIKKHQQERKESQMVVMINPVLDSIDMSIKKKDVKLFTAGFNSLTNTCNNCHRLVNYGFNDVKIPDSPPFSNQIFKKENK